MQLNKNYQRHFGVDKKSSDLTRPQQYAEDMLNSIYLESGSIAKRVGYQMHAEDAGGLGTFAYNKADVVTGNVSTEILTIDQNLYRLKTTTLAVTYSGASANAIISIFLDESSQTYKCQIEEGLLTVLDYDLGTGFDVASPVTITTLAAQINLIPNFAAVITGAGSTPAAFIEIVRAHDLSSTGSAYAGVAKYWEQVYCPLTNPFATYYADRNSATHENVSSTQIQNVIYFGSGFEEIYKYDGQSFYRAGLPDPGAISVSLAGGAVTGNNYVHRVQYIYYDKAGNLWEGNAGFSSAQNAAANSFNVTVPQVSNTTGFNTNCGIVNGNQVSVTTITLTVGHTLQVGDTAYFYDQLSTAYVEKVITARTSTTISFVGAVSVNNLQVISANLRIGIYRSKTSGSTPSTFYLVDEIPNNSFVSSVVYNDNVADASLGRLFIAPATDRQPPAKGRYVSQWNGIMMVGGQPTAPTLLSYSDIEGCEYFDPAQFAIDIQPGNGDTITAIAPNNEIFTVHGQNAFTVISGDVLSNQLRVETRSRDVGCVAHATISDMDGVLLWLSPDGPRYSQGGQVPLPLGAAAAEVRQDAASRIDPEFDNSGKTEVERFKFKRANSFVNSFKKYWILFVPAESQNTGQVYVNSNSRIYVYDKTRDAWLIWDNIDMSSGMVNDGDTIYFQERRFSSYHNAVVSNLYKINDLSDDWDYADNINAISMDYAPQWDFLNEPSVLKKATNLKLFSLESMDVGSFTVTCEQEINFEKDAPSAIFDITLLSGGYGISPYGEERYGSPGEGTAIHTLRRDRTFATRIRFKNDTLHENPIITGWEVEFSTPFRPEFKP